MTIDQTLKQAIAHHQASQLEDAEKLYLAILKTHPNHPEANHKMGVLAVQTKQPLAGLSYLMTALEANPAHGQYWLSYIDALFQTDQLEAAREVLVLARQYGLERDEIEALSVRLEGNAPVTEQTNVEYLHAAKESLPVSPAVLQSSKKKSKSKSTKLDKSARKSTLHKGNNPNPQEINVLLRLFTDGRYTEATTLAQIITVRFPRHEFGWKALGTVFQKMGRSADALIPLRKATTLAPSDAETHSNLGATLHELGRLNEAEASYRRALKIKPNYAEAHNNLGNVLKDLGHLDEAEASYRQALKIMPDYAEAHNNLGNVLKDLGRLDEAEASYRQALEVMPNYADAHYNLGNTLKDQGYLDEAEVSYRRFLKIRPNYVEAHNNLGNTLKDMNRLDEAEASYRQALKIMPDSAEAYNNLGVILKDLNRLDEAEASCRQALKIMPDFAEAYNNLGIILKNLNRLDEADASCRQALEIMPYFTEAYNNLGNILQSLCRPDEAEDSFRQALKIMPDLAEAHSNLLFCLSLMEGLEASALFAEHVRFGEQFEVPLRANWPPHSNSRNPDRCLQIGFVSGDLYNHAVATFMEPLLIQLSGYPQLSLHAYANHSMDDSVSQRLRRYFAHWHPIAALSDAALAEKIRADSIDILIDLSGHTAKNRLLTFARKPAPVQVSWMGYPGTTGLQAMDYYFADRFFSPLGQFDEQFTEKIVRLPASAPFLPSKDASPVNTLPALSKGYITFGSFNRTNKLSHAVISLWAQLLRALPDSRMLLGGLPEAGKYETLIEWFTQQGIARNRLNFYPRSDMGSYLGLHQQVDICLDTFPYNGGTTTLHALWMGVPTLTLAGSTPAGRSGTCILGNAGLEAFITQSPEDFVQKGLSWAGNLAGLSDIRAGLRERIAKSAMGQPAVVAAGVECALRRMWQRWCAGLPAESFEVKR